MNSMRFPLPTLATALALTLLAATPAWAREPVAPMPVPVGSGGGARRTTSRGGCASDG